jgi:Ni,Fe-hydrogenase I cytochrome b subunit
MARTLLARELVYDPVLRLLHAWNALLIVLLAASGQLGHQLELAWPAAAVWRLHLWLGYGLLLGLTGRVIWALVGPEHARWNAMWHPRAWWLAVRAREWFSAPTRYGHHPLASAPYLMVYAATLFMAVSGLALAAIDQGTGPLHAWLGYAAELKPWFRVPHEWLQYLFIAFVIAHLGALVTHERRHGVPMAQAMVSGYQYLKEEE